MKQKNVWAALAAAGPGCAMAADAAAGAGAFAGPAIGPVPLEFVFFACVLLGVALFHQFTLRIALSGAVFIALYKILLSPFKSPSQLRLPGPIASNMAWRTAATAAVGAVLRLLTTFSALL